MNILKRAWVSITRRKLNSLILLLIVFILANVLLTTLTVKNSLSKTKEMVLKQFPPVVTADYNTKNFKDGTPRLTVEMADKLYDETENLVKSYDYSIPFYFEKGKNLKFSEIPGLESMNTNVNFKESMTARGTQLLTTGLVAKGEAKLISGKGFSKADISEGNPKVIISKQLAETNQLQVGSYLPVTRVLRTYDPVTQLEGDPYFSEDIDLEIVGIIEIDKVDHLIEQQTGNSTSNINSLGQIQELSDMIYVPNKFILPLINDNIEQVKKEYPGKDPNIYPGVPQRLDIYPTFILHDMNDLDAFLKMAKLVYNEKDYVLNSSASDYEVVAAPLNSMEDLMDLVFKISLIANIIVLTLVLYIFMYLRQKEMGVFLALGERRTKIIGQLIMETLTIAIIGATLAIFTSMIFSNMLTNNTVASLMAPTKEVTNTITTMNSGSGITPEMISQQVQNGFGMMTLVLFYILIAGTVLLSQIATILYLIRLNPKKILM